MTVREAIETRRAYRSLEPAEISPALVRDLAGAARLAPSCNNNQPWRFVFVAAPAALAGVHPALSASNDWVKAASLIVAVCARREDDCLIKDREYYLYDAGMATAFLILRAGELGLVAHPFAGFSPAKIRAALGVPEDHQVAALIAVGSHAETIGPLLTPKQAEIEKSRPERLPFDRFAFINRWNEPLPREEGR